MPSTKRFRDTGGAVRVDFPHDLYACYVNPIPRWRGIACAVLSDNLSDFGFFGGADLRWVSHRIHSDVGDTLHAFLALDIGKFVIQEEYVHHVACGLQTF